MRGRCRLYWFSRAFGCCSKASPFDANEAGQLLYPLYGNLVLTCHHDLTLLSDVGVVPEGQVFVQLDAVERNVGKAFHNFKHTITVMCHICGRFSSSLLLHSVSSFAQAQQATTLCIRCNGNIC